MKWLVGTKEYMTQIFLEDGSAVPATVITAGPITVTQVKNTEKDGYTAVQVGFGTKSDKHANKPEKGHTKELGNFRVFAEHRDVSGVHVGDKFDTSIFAEGDSVTVSGTTKSKGFQGVVKRHGFAGGPRTHGQKHSEREPGSIGGGLRTHVPKNMRMAGRMGGDKVSVKGLKIVKIDSAHNTIFVSGAIPGRRGTVIEIEG